MTMKIKTWTRNISPESPTYIIAEIGSNFDGNLKKAYRLIDLAKKCGADCAKFQSFVPEKIVSKGGFGEQRSSFQSKWKKPVYDVYKDAALPRSWHKKLAGHCKKKQIDFASSPYDKEAVDSLVATKIPYLKIGSGEVTNLDFIKCVAATKKPLLISVGASTLAEIDEVMQVVQAKGKREVVLLQCVTNYPSPIEDANLNVLNTLKNTFKVMVGYSDHTPGHTVVLGAVALGAKVIEKHFTDDKKSEGPDHPFAMDTQDFKTMVEEIRKLELAMGNGIKTIYPSEKMTKILQRRSLYTTREINRGEVIRKDMLTVLRPAKGLAPKYLEVFIGKVSSLPKYVQTNGDSDYVVEIIFVDNNNPKILMGMIGDAEILLTKTESEVPALFFDEIYYDNEDNPYLYVLENEKIVKLPIEIGIEGDLYTEIKTEVTSKIVQPFSDKITLEEGMKAKVSK